jgi:hypothetical protein
VKFNYYVAWEAVKEAVGKEAEIKLVPSEKDDDNEEDQEAWPSGSSDDDSPIRFPRVKRWFKCSIFLKNMYEHKNSVLSDIDNFIAEEMRKLSMLLKAYKRDL